jgi:hypothetical protein
VQVQVEVTASYVRLGMTAANRPQDENDDLWDRLVAADRRHTLTWQWSEAAFMELDETATETLRDRR